MGGTEGTRAMWMQRRVQPKSPIASAMCLSAVSDPPLHRANLDGGTHPPKRRVFIITSRRRLRRLRSQSTSSSRRSAHADAEPMPARMLLAPSRRRADPCPTRSRRPRAAVPGRCVSLAETAARSSRRLSPVRLRPAPRFGPGVLLLGPLLIIGTTSSESR